MRLRSNKLDRNSNVLKILRYLIYWTPSNLQYINLFKRKKFNFGEERLWWCLSNIDIYVYIYVCTIWSRQKKYSIRSRHVKCLWSNSFFQIRQQSNIHPSIISEEGVRIRFRRSRNVRYLDDKLALWPAMYRAKLK